MLQERRSGQRQLRRAAAALKKPLAQLGLQRADLLADRRLREVERLGGAPETLQGRDGLDGEELIERHDLLLIVIGFMKKYHLDYMPPRLKIKYGEVNAASLEPPARWRVDMPHTADNAQKIRSDDDGSGGAAFVKNTASTMAVLALIAVGLLIVWIGTPMIRGSRDEQWKALFAEGERARESGDRYRALEMYMHSARIA